MIRAIRLGALVLAALILLPGMFGCRQTEPTSIQTLLDDPARFDHQTVRIVGTVTSAVGVLGYGAYRLDDGTGTLTVIARDGGAPRSGARVGVEGEFRAAFTLGTQSVAVLMESGRFTPKE
jgi:hypothetical protein